MEELIRSVMTGTVRGEYLVVTGVAGSIALMTGLVGAWIGAYFGGRRGARRAIEAAREQPSALVEANLAELRHAMDSIALEVERMAEGQRFTARMLMERVAVPPSIDHRRDGASVTPH